jgi:hypothetical protein
VSTSGSKVQKKLQPGPPRRGATTGPPWSFHGPVGLELVATPMAESPPQPGSPLTSGLVSVMT